MLLAIDAGNTNTVFAVFAGERPGGSWRLRTEGRRSADEYAGFLHQVFALSGVDFKQIRAVIVSSVVPEADFHIADLCGKYLGVKPVFVSKDNVPVELKVERPGDVGADRLVNAVAVKAHYTAPAIVIDFGTATTFDVIDADGAYAGGVIAPGIDLSVEALHRAASKLPKISVEKPGKVIGGSTVQAMRSGIYYGYAGLIDGVVRGIRGEMGCKDVLVLATGGLAGLFAEGSDVIERVDRELTLKGLYEIYKSLSDEA
ncbi:MAG: type III pantothenate kinase [Alphaproteobacteria bacterium]